MLKKFYEYIVFSGLSASLGLLGVVYMTRTITPEEYGVIGIFLALLYVLPQMISFSSTGLVSINKVKLSEKEFILFSRSFFSFGIINFMGILVFSAISSFFFQEYKLIFWVLPVLALLQYLSSFHNMELVQDRLSKRYGVYRLIISALSLSLTILCISYFDLTWDGRLIALLFAEMIALMIAYRLSFKTLHKFRFDFNLSDFKDYVYFGSPLLLALGAGWVLNQADKFILLNFFTLKDVGIYTVAYSIGMIVNLINQAATNTIVPTVYRHLENNEGSKIIKKLNIYYSLMILSISLTIGLCSYLYVPLLFGEGYSDSPAIILFIALAFGFNGVYRTTGLVLAFYKQNKLQMYLLYLSAFVNIVFSIALIPIFGMLSPAIATMFAYMLLAYLSYIYGWRIIKRKERLCSEY